MKAVRKIPEHTILYHKIILKWEKRIIQMLRCFVMFLEVNEIYDTSTHSGKMQIKEQNLSK